MDVTLFLIPGDHAPNIDRAITSFGKNLLRNVVVCETREPAFQEAQAPYCAYMYTDEWCDNALRLALPVFFQLQNRYWDSLSLFRKNVRDNRVFIAPRVFKSGIQMDGLNPKYPTPLVFERVLNGFLRG